MLRIGSLFGSIALLVLAACTQAGPTPTPTATSPPISRERAIELASINFFIPSDVIARADVSAQLNGDVWEVTFDNVNVWKDDLPWPDGAMGGPALYKTLIVRVNANTGTGGVFSAFSSSTEWQLAEAPGWLSQAGFSLLVPGGWQLRELQGIDSYVGEIVGDGVRLTFDYGQYSSPLPYAGDPEYTVTYEEIGGRRAKLVRPKEGVEGVTGVYFEGIDSTPDHTPTGGLGNVHLTVYGQGLTSEQQELAFAIFRSVRINASGHFRLEIAGLDPDDRVALQLERLKGIGQFPGQGDPLWQVEVGNGRWEESFYLREGRYALVPDAPGYVSVPEFFGFNVSAYGTVYGTTWGIEGTLEFRHAEDAETRSE